MRQGQGSCGRRKESPGEYAEGWVRGACEETRTVLSRAEVQRGGTWGKRHS